MPTTSKSLRSIRAARAQAADEQLLPSLGLDFERLPGGPGEIAVDGTNGPDTLNGTAGDDVLNGLAGDDTLNGLGGNDVLNGGNNNDILNGAEGNDTLDGGAGNDAMTGGTGDDIYFVNSVSDSVSENAGEGTDEIRTSLSSYSLAGRPDVENLTGLGTNQELTGNAGSNVITAGSGHDTLDGQGGADTMIGGGGNDVYKVDDAGDTVVELAGGGADQIQTTLAVYSLVGTYVEYLASTFQSGASLTGNEFGNGISGGIGNDTLYGLDGNDFLDGGSGNDTMVGGAGDDSFRVNGPGDTVVEEAGGGNDIVYESLITYTLPANVERGTAEGGPVQQTLNGNELDNELVSDGNDFLYGLGGNDTLTVGTDGTMIGGTGDDTYNVLSFASGVLIVENAGEGIDTIWTGRATFSLASLPNVENLYLVPAFAAGVLTGNGLDNVLRGNNVGDTLDGGAGADTMIGRGGGDTYYVDNEGDTIVEEAGDTGTDTVRSSVDYTLGANVENLIANSAAGLALTGNELANVVTGGDGNDILNGRLGADTLEGKAGADTYAFTSPLGGGNIDTIVGFASGSDKIGLDEDVFVGVNSGNLASVFVAGTQAQDADDRIIYDQATGQLFYDADGTGAGAQVQFALLQGAVPLSASDFMILPDQPGQTLTGTPNNDTLIGGDGDDTINALGGNDILDGRLGTDVMNGGAGDDQYFVDSPSDVVNENADEGYDIVFASASYGLGAGQHVELLGTIDNTATTPLTLIGNELANYVTGNAGANILDGGAGPDQLWGRGGDDSYYADAGDDVVEYDGDGYDILYARSSYALGVGQSIEVLATIDNTATTAINLAGNAFSNYIVGNAGSNTLDGGGGSDQLWGREGDDSYIADMNDIVLEYAGQGSDILYASEDYILAAGLSIETLATVDNTATTGIDLTGNELDNYVTGNAGANTLDGGTGSDTLWGRSGDDSYFADGNDVVLENAGEGSDIIYARGSFVLGAGVSVETLATVDNTATNALNLTGNELANYVTGNAGANILDGGAGADQLFGRGGADSFAFTSALGGGNVDTILDFVAGTDKIALDDAIFSGIGTPGSFDANAFVAGSSAADANDRIIYNQATGQLYYDADGNGAGAQILFATLSGSPAIGAGDFAVI